VDNVATSKLQQILSEMDTALADEIKAQSSRKSADHIAIDGKLVAEESGHYVYSFSLKDPWEPEDDTPIRIKISSTPSVKGTIVTSTGTTITIATEQVLPPEALRRIEMINDSTQLLERLRDALKNNNEGESQLGSKSFGLLSFDCGKRPSPMTFGKFIPDDSQNQAILMALGSQITYIVGPPGTGKTSTLAAIAFAHLCEGRSVLITAHTNIAVDNAVMKLADICREAGALDELRRGHVVRYGTPQHRKLIEDNKYADIYLPKIIERRGSDLYRQQETLKASLRQILSNLDAVALTKAGSKEKWQTERLSLSTQRDNYQAELAPLHAREQQRLASLEGRLHHFTNQLQQMQQYKNSVHLALAQLAAQQVQWDSARTEHLRQVNNLASQLAEAQQMSPVKLFFKRIDPKRLAQQLADAKQQLWNANNLLAELQKRIEAAHISYAEAEKHIEQLTISYRETMTQRNALSPDSGRIATLRTAIAQYDQRIAQGDASLQRDHEDIQQKRDALQSDTERIKEQIAAIDKQMMDLEKSIVAEAHVVATTLSKTYMNHNLCERRFDVVILDEVSMAPLPAVYIAASRADVSVVAIGDPHQLAPIFTAGTSAAQQWLGTDLFAQNGISLDGAVNGYGNSTLLKKQSRMHPNISVIARKHVYKGQIVDRERNDMEAYAKVAPSPGKQLLLCDTSDALPITTRPEGGSRINVYHALCTIAIARQVLASLPESDIQQSSRQRIGLVTPYRKQAELLQYLIQDAGLQGLIRAGTVHRFQGLEFEVVIFDTVESPPVPPRDGFTAGQWGSQAMRLINVAVTRPKHKLIVIANVRWIWERFQAHDILRLAIDEAQKAGIMKSREVLNINIPTSSLSKLSPTLDAIQYEPELLDDRTFFDRFLDDVHKAKKQVVIFSPFLDIKRTSQIIPALTERQKAGVRITVIASQSTDNDPTTTKAGILIKEAGAELRTLSGMHQKLVFIDEEIVYTGSLNVLSHTAITEFMERVKSPKFAKKVWQFMNVDTVVETPVKWGPDIVLSSSVLPNTVCEKCGKAMVVRIGRYGPFYGCRGFPNCNQIEEISEKHLRNLKQLANVYCDNCSDNTLMHPKTYRKDAWLECSAPRPCGYRRRIKII